MFLTGWILLLAGLAVGLWGFYTALKPVADMYRQATIDPLADTMPEDGKQIVSEMVEPLAIGAIGGVTGSVGSFMLMVARRRRKMLKKLQSRG